jgi:di/tricarboxylate transporter
MLTPEIVLVLLILGSAIVAFVAEVLPVDLVALLVLLALTLTGLLTPREALAGFSNPAVITIIGIFIVSAAMVRTGAAGDLSRRLLKLAGGQSGRLVALVMAAAGGLSLFMNNIAAAAMLLPAVMGVARDSRILPSRLLIPLSFGTLLGGMATLFTTTNILTGDALRGRGLAPFTLFDFVPIGGLVALAGIGFMALIGYRLLPERPAAGQLAQAHQLHRDLAEIYHLSEKLFQARVRPGSSAAGKTIADCQFGRAMDLTVLGIVRDSRTQLAPGPDTVLQAGDLLLVEGEVGALRDLAGEQGLEAVSEGGNGDVALASDEVGIVELALSPRASCVGQTLRDLHFREKFGLSVLAIWREGQPIRTHLADIPLRFGDGLLVQGPWARIRVLRSEPDFLVLEEAEPEVAQVRQRPVAILILVGMVAAVALDLVPISIAALGAAVLVVLSGILRMDEAYRAVEWRAVFLIAGMLPLGTALDKTGAAQLLAHALVNAVGGLGPLPLLAGLFGLTMLLTQVMSAAATAVLIAPIAINAAAQMGANPRALMMGVALATSTAFLTPVSHPANLLVMGPGGYRFADYARVGLPLTLVVLLVVLIALPVLWPLS